MSNDLPGTGIIRRMVVADNAGTTAASGFGGGEDPDIRLGMERMSVHLHEYGNEGQFSRAKANECARRAHRRKHDA